MKKVSRLQEQLQAERDLRSALEVGLSMSSVQFLRMFARLKKKVAELHLQINQQHQRQCRSSSDDVDLYQHFSTYLSQPNIVPQDFDTSLAFLRHEKKKEMRSQDDVQKIAIACNQYNVPIVPFGGATSIEGHTLAPNGGVRIDMSMMKQIKALHVEDMDVVVEPGIGWMELIDYLKPYGLFFPLDPGPGATIGGMCATSCSGSLAVRYGTMRDVISLQVVLGNGDVVKTAARARKSASGWFISGHWKDQRMMSFLWSFKFKLPLLWITNLICEVALQSWRLELGNLGGWRWEILEAGPRKSWRMEVEFSVPNAELRLLEVFYHKIYKIFPPSEKIENINDQYWTLRA